MKVHLSCQFMLVTNGKYGPCGKEATFRFKNSPLCDQCADYVKGRGNTIVPITEEFVKKVKERKAKKLEELQA